MKTDLTPHQKIVRAAKRGRGIRLTRADVQILGVLDDAIVTAAQSAACDKCLSRGRYTTCMHDPDAEFDR